MRFHHSHAIALTGLIRTILGLFLAVNIFRLKARREEQLLEAEFGSG